jgi:hypothetical protein
MHRRWLLAVTAMLCVLAGPMALTQAAERYLIQELPLTPSGINDEGDIVGQNSDALAVVLLKQGDGYQPFVLGGGVMQDINQTRYAVGSVEGVGIVWTPTTGMRRLPVTCDGCRTEPLGVSPGQIIVGRTWDNCEDFDCDMPRAIAIRSNHKEVILLDDLGGMESIAWKVNGSGQIAGSSSLPDERSHAMRCTMTEGCLDLGSFAGGRSVAFGISGKFVVGVTDMPDGQEGAAFIFSDADGMHPLAELPGWRFSVAHAINGIDEIVGSAVKGSLVDGREVAVLWDADGVPIELETQLIDGEGWELGRATAINLKGEIVGTGTLNGEFAGFLLVPQTSP